MNSCINNKNKKRFKQQKRWNNKYNKFFKKQLINPNIKYKYKLMILACSIWGVCNISHIPKESHIWLKLSISNILLDTIEIDNVDMILINWFLKK